MTTHARIAASLLFAFAGLSGCSQIEDESATVTEAARAPWAKLAAATVAEYYRRNPERAVNAGLHEYDGQISDLSPAAVADYVAWARNTRSEAAAYDDLEGMEAFERDYLVNKMDGEIFWGETSTYLSRSPAAYVNRLGFSAYLDREYAPLDIRLRGYTNYVSRFPAFFETMKSNLKPPLAGPLIEMSLARFGGLVAYMETTVPGIFSSVENEALQAEFTAANAAAVEAVRHTVTWLEGLRETAQADFALGGERFLEMLCATEGVDITLVELKAAGEKDLERNLALLDEACAEFAPDESIRECVKRVQDQKPKGGPVAGARAQLPGLRKFLEEQKLVTIPGTEQAVVDEAPPHRRTNSAYIRIPGPYEVSLPSVYYIAPPDPSWTEEDQLAYIPGESDLLFTTVHEVWPGHFLHYLHANRARNNVGQHFRTYTFSEGWAHYSEEMMADAGLDEGRPDIRIGQLLNALLRNVRYLSAIGLHAEGMTVEESHRMFEEKAFADYGTAYQQSLRGTYDPGYLNYTLGKLMIRKLREDWSKGRGGREAWGRFHDEILSYGNPPVPLLRDQMLGEHYDGDTALLP
jgi:roadblock/LC7 domain-containing protein